MVNRESTQMRTHQNLERPPLPYERLFAFNDLINPGSGFAMIRGSALLRDPSALSAVNGLFQTASIPFPPSLRNSSIGV